VAVFCVGAGPAAAAGGKDCLRSAALLVGEPQQSPTANSETFTSPRLMQFNVVDEMFPDTNFAPFRRRVPALD
jgi:hypothetical protein